MGWCVARAVRSCQTQTQFVNEIIVVDDCSTDDTETVVRRLIAHDPRIRYFRLLSRGGHIAALTLGARKATSDWIALLDADDELTPNSIEARVSAANHYEKVTGVQPQLVYGDQKDGTKFARVSGYVFPYLCKELCLCQTSTILLGRKCIPYIPVTTNPWNTDDEIVLAIGKHFHVMHSGADVAIVHAHSSPTRMTNPKRMFIGVRQMVWQHRADIICEHGIRRFFLWGLRVLKVFMNYQLALANAQIQAQSHLVGAPQRFLWRVYRKGLLWSYRPLIDFLAKHFDTDYF